jgi:hypothetical protein
MNGLGTARRFRMNRVQHRKLAERVAVLYGRELDRLNQRRRSR